MMFKKNKNAKPASSSKKTKFNLGTGLSMGKQAYEASVAKRALERAGKNQNLKGHINEIMTIDKLNSKPANILKGKRAVLSKSPTAVRDDILLKQGGKIKGRFQVKDTISKSGIKKTVDQVKNHQYKGTQLVGTKETVAAYGKEIAKNKKATQKMISNNISSDQTSLVAQKALGSSKEGIIKNSGKIARQASETAKKSALFTAGVESAKNVVAVKKGKKSIKEAAVSVANETAISAASATTGDAAATAATIGVATIPGMAPVAPLVGMATGFGVSMATEKIIRNGEEKIINNKE